jgi:hypothetical protein
MLSVIGVDPRSDRRAQMIIPLGVLMDGRKHRSSQRAHSQKMPL